MAKQVPLENLPQISLLEDVSRESASRIIEQLSAFKGTPVALDIFCDGGSVHGSVAVARFIENPANNLNVEARVYGNAFSGAMIIAAACHRAYIAAGSFGLVHKAYAKGEDGKRIADADLAETDRNELAAMNADQINLFSKRSGKSKSAVEKLMDEDRPMTADEAIAFGLFDGIIPQSTRLAAFKTATMSNEKKATRTIKVKVAHTLSNVSAVALGNEIAVEVPETEFTVSEADKLAELNTQIEALTKERDEKQAALAEAEKKATEAESATATKETELQAAAKDRDAFKAQVETLTKKPAVAQVTPDGGATVIPGGDPKGDNAPYKSAREKELEASSKSWNDAVELYLK